MSQGPAPALSYVSQTSSVSSVEMVDEDRSSTRYKKKYSTKLKPV